MTRFHLPKPVATAIMPYLVVRPKLSRPRSVVVRAIVEARRRTGRLGPLPDFAIIGTQRAGTTFLYDALLDQPDVYPALAKEIHYFDRHAGLGDDWYRANFSPHLADRARPLTGEATPCYLAHPRAAERMARSTPETKLIVVLRDPVERAYSHYSLMCALGHEELTFEQALDAESDRTDAAYQRMIDDDSYYSRDWNLYSYMRRGRYVEQLEEWLRHFPRDQILVLDFADLRADPSATAGDVAAFVGLRRVDGLGADRRKAVGQHRVTTPDAAYLDVDDDLRQRLRRAFDPLDRQLVDLLGRDVSWRQGTSSP